MLQDAPGSDQSADRGLQSIYGDPVWPPCMYAPWCRQRRTLLTGTRHLPYTPTSGIYHFLQPHALQHESSNTHACWLDASGHYATNKHMQSHNTIQHLNTPSAARYLMHAKPDMHVRAFPNRRFSNHFLPASCHYSAALPMLVPSAAGHCHNFIIP
jgi:hypothetical protein